MFARSHAHADLGGVSRNNVIRAGLSAPHATTGKRPPVPGVIAEDAVGFSDDVPSLDVVKISAIRFARLDVLCLKLGFQLADLCIGERHYFVLTLSTGLELLI